MRARSGGTPDRYYMALILTTLLPSGEGFWIGKASLRRWRQLATEQLGHHQDDEFEQGDVKVNGSAPKKGKIPATGRFL